MTSTALDLNHHPATALAIQPGQISWDPTQLAALGQLGLTDAGDGDRAVFLHVCQRTGLDPFARQIYMIGRNEKVPGTQNSWRTKWTIQTGIDGYRVNRTRAERKAGVRGVLGRAIFYDHEGNEYKVWVQPRPPAACEITYTVKDGDGGETPYTSVLRFAEYCQVNKDGNPIAQWVTKPAHMLEKCTEADVYRKAFPQDFSGIYLDDTMPPQEDAPPAPPRGRVTAGEVIGRGGQEPPQTAAAGDSTRNQRQAGTQAPRPGADDDADPAPAAAGAAPSPDAQPLPPLPARATTGQLSMLGQRLGKLGVGDDSRLSVLEKLAGRDPGEPQISKPADLTQDEAAHIRGLLDRCDGDRGALVELLATGQLPEAGGGDG
jgi:phage recombination protein Bet